jgi:hypothetical protein
LLEKTGRSPGFFFHFLGWIYREGPFNERCAAAVWLDSILSLRSDIRSEDGRREEQLLTTVFGALVADNYSWCFAGPWATSAGRFPPVESLQTHFSLRGYSERYVRQRRCASGALTVADD